MSDFELIDDSKGAVPIEDPNANPFHGRFRDAPWYVKNEVYVSIGGAGGIGSWVALLIARAGFIPCVYDFDTIETHNLSGQIFRKIDITKSKVVALQDIIQIFCDQISYVFNQKVDKDTPTNELMISAFDNMEARQVFFNNWLRDNAENKRAIFLDGRLQAEHMQIFCVRGGDAEAIKNYASEHLFNDSEVKDDDTICTMRQTSHAAAMIAAHMVGFFTNHIANVMAGDEGRSIPFYWEYFIPIDYIEH